MQMNLVPIEQFCGRASATRDWPVAIALVTRLDAWLAMLVAILPPFEAKSVARLWTAGAMDVTPPANVAGWPISTGGSGMSRGSRWCN